MTSTELAAQLTVSTIHLARLGWELRSVEVDSVARRVDVQAHHTSGRWVHLRISDRGATLERWQRSVSTVSGGRVPTYDRVDDQFLGRAHITGGVSDAMRALVDYLVDNTPHQLAQGTNILEYK